MPAEFPTRPADVPDVSLRELVGDYHHHTGRLVDAHAAIGEPLSADTLAGHAIAALAVQHALAERVLYSRWCTARDALTFGATVEQVAAGMGLDVDEVVMGLTSWAVGQHREGLSTAVERDEVLALVDRPDPLTWPVFPEPGRTTIFCDRRR